jgi:hypothetical protein
MLTFIDSRLRNIKRIHNKIMGGLDVIMIGYFYQATLVQDPWILKSRINGLNVLGTHLWQENIKCYELKQVMHQNDLQFIHILNIFWMASHIFEYINFINQICLWTPSIDNILPILFYINAKKIEHNKTILQNTLGQTFTFHAKDIHFETCPPHFKLPMVPSQITSLHHELSI